MRLLQHTEPHPRQIIMPQRLNKCLPASSTCSSMLPRTKPVLRCLIRHTSINILQWAALFPCHVRDCLSVHSRPACGPQSLMLSGIDQAALGLYSVHPVMTSFRPDVLPLISGRPSHMNRRRSGPGLLLLCGCGVQSHELITIQLITSLLRSSLAQSVRCSL